MFKSIDRNEFILQEIILIINISSSGTMSHMVFINIDLEKMAL